MTSTPCAYMTAPSSPNEYSRSNSMEFYYSAPTSPLRKAGYGTTDDHPGSNLDEFEFETSKRWLPDDLVNFDTSKCPSGGGCGRDHKATMQKYRERADSLPAMAFADELFVNGLVMPLKPPPRLHFNSFCEKSPVSSPKSPIRGLYKIPFTYKNLWNDDFDPFMEALEKVREEKRGRNSHQKRSRSYSPFRAVSRSCSSIDSDRNFHNQELHKGNREGPMQVPVPPSSHSGPLDFKGSAYARFVRDQAKQGLSPKNSRPFLSGQRVRPLKIEHDGADMPASPKGKYDEKSNVQKLKGFLLRYASFGRVDNGKSKLTKTSSEARKPSYFSKLSFKFKGNANSNVKRKVPAAADDTKMAVVKYKKPSIGLCLSSQVQSP